MERVSVFIDGSNLYHGLKSNKAPTTLNFHKFGLHLSNGRKLIRIYYYTAPRDQQAGKEQYQAQQRFLDALHRTPYLEVKLGRLLKRGQTYVEKGVDIMIATDMISFAYQDAYDTAILVSGDGDFVSCVRAVKDAGKHVENACFKNSRANHLMQVCDTFFELTPSMIKQCV